MAEAAMNEIWWMMFSQINMAGMANQVAAKVRVRFMVMVWLEGGQGEVRGAPPPPPRANHQGLVPPPTTTPNCPTWTPPPPSPLPPMRPPPKGPSAHFYFGGGGLHTKARRRPPVLPNCAMVDLQVHK